MSIWDNPEMSVGGDYIKFDAVGDTVTGKVLVLGIKRWDDGSVAPQMVLDTADGERTLTAGQVRLKAELAEKRPEEGDTITVTLASIEKRTGGKTLKHFDVAVQRAGDPAPAAATPAAPAPAPPAADGLTPEQKAALKAAGL